MRPTRWITLPGPWTRQKWRCSTPPMLAHGPTRERQRRRPAEHAPGAAALGEVACARTGQVATAAAVSDNDPGRLPRAVMITPARRARRWRQTRTEAPRWLNPTRAQRAQIVHRTSTGRQARRNI